MDFRTSQWAPLVINSVKTVHNPSYKAYKSVSSMQGQRYLALVVITIILASVLGSVFFQRAMRRCRAIPTVFNFLLLLRSRVLQVNLVIELAIMLQLLLPPLRLHWLLCGFFNGLSGVLAFTITYLTCWLGLVRLLLLAVARWAPRHAWKLTSGVVYVIIGLIYVASVYIFASLLQPGVPFLICVGLPVDKRPSPNTTAVGVLLLISTAANTLLLYADATLPPAPPRHRNVISARCFAVLTLCEQLLILLWAPASALTAGVTRSLLTRVLMIGQAGLMDTVGLALISPQLRLALLGGRRTRPRCRRAKKVAPVPIIRLELI
ncbi:hypothetical protein FJT64_008165 [Amphibalanus amphitrite]|uniref:Uncharacterized protein n=1 Tax=Amphibalanus amphitrite TaxID=1232801 RepID=A0A6A4VW77_AMPAM|nr:hypothetical protein FJT64_008165 [Amphibalanus amphitrite]